MIVDRHKATYVIALSAMTTEGTTELPLRYLTKYLGEV